MNVQRSQGIGFEARKVTIKEIDAKSLASNLQELGRKGIGYFVDGAKPDVIDLYNGKTLVAQYRNAEIAETLSKTGSLPVYA